MNLVDFLSCGMFKTVSKQVGETEREQIRNAPVKKGEPLLNLFHLYFLYLPANLIELPM